MTFPSAVTAELIHPDDCSRPALHTFRNKSGDVIARCPSCQRAALLMAAEDAASSTDEALPLVSLTGGAKSVDWLDLLGKCEARGVPAARYDGKRGRLVVLRAVADLDAWEARA